MNKFTKRTWRKYGRFLRGVVRKGNVEPVVFLMVLNLLLSGVTLLASTQTPVLCYPKLFGFAYLLLATVGTLGLFGRDHRLKAAFGFVGLFLRLWMATRFCLSDWQNPMWCSHALGAVAFGWIGARSACRYVWLETRRQWVGVQGTEE